MLLDIRLLWNQVPYYSLKGIHIWYQNDYHMKKETISLLNLYMYRDKLVIYLLQIQNKRRGKERIWKIKGNGESLNPKLHPQPHPPLSALSFKQILIPKAPSFSLSLSLYTFLSLIH